MRKVKREKEGNKEVVYTSMTGQEILYHPLLNKGTGFTSEERTLLHLHGLLPPHCSTIEEQVKRRYRNFSKKTDGLAKYSFLTSLQDRNETLFYRLIQEYPEEILPYIYTPTVGEASVVHSYLYSQNRGIYISYELKDQLDEVIQNIPRDEVSVIVVTDGQRILGLGDLGVGGMVIPVGKLSLYTAFGGIHPAKTLPILLDVGTDNEELLKDPLYLGWKHRRIKGEEYFSFIDQFVHTLLKRFPNALLQWEDFGKSHALKLLNKYQDSICSFNDDIQGTAAVSLAAILAAIYSKGESLATQKIAIYGAGSAGIGIANLLVMKMMREGIDEKEAYERIFLFNSKGLVYEGNPRLSDELMPYVKQRALIAQWKGAQQEHMQISLEESIQHIEPTILIGVSAQPHSFTESIIKKMYASCKNPVILPLSNPTSKSEAVPEDLIQWTDGHAIIATGSPFAPVNHNGKTHAIGQCNNVYVFPGVGLGAVSVQSKTVTDSMFLKAAEVLSMHAPILKDRYASTFPGIANLKKLSRKVAIAVAEQAFYENLTTCRKEEIPNLVDQHRWDPEYALFRPMGQMITA